MQANHAFYVAKDYARVLQLIPDDAKRPSYTPLAFSRQVLRGQALAAKGDPNEAGFWLELLGGAKALWQRPTVELGLAMNWERHGKLAQVFAPGSPITDRMVREILLMHSAGPGLLRRVALDVERAQTERDAALFTLLYKQLSRGTMPVFGPTSRWRAVMPRPTGCGALRPVRPRRWGCLRRVAPRRPASPVPPCKGLSPRWPPIRRTCARGCASASSGG